MPKPDPFAARAEEFNRLIAEQGLATRSMKYGWRPDEEQRRVIDDRAARLIELAELMGPRIADAQHAPFGAEAYVNERIAQWMRANPLALMNLYAAEKLTEQENAQFVVSVQIGEPGKGGHLYQCVADDLRKGPDGQLRLHVPDSLAEIFRQQGRRKVQREIAALLALKSHF